MRKVGGRFQPRNTLQGGNAWKVFKFQTPNNGVQVIIELNGCSTNTNIGRDKRPSAATHSLNLDP
jgi:hypothetical protein